MEAASTPNPALESFEVLIGEWSTEGTHPLFPGVTLHGRASFEWLEGGAFVLMRAKVDHPDFPRGVAVIGSDDAAGSCFMLYFDERGVSRKYDVTLRDNVLKWWREDPGFAQRFTGTIAPDADVMVVEGEMARDGSPWEGDLSLTYTRIR
jgi:hypothetical protein